MTETGDDCYFYYYSTCARGDECPFRHQPAARGCEITCNLWEKGRCFRKPCKFRHMVIEKNRATIPCVWESQPSGCMKPYCPFLHTKPKSPPASQANMAPQSIPTLGTPGYPGNPGRGGPSVRPPVFNNNPPRPRIPPSQPQYMGGPQPMQQRPMGYQGFIPHTRPSHPTMYQMHYNSQSHMSTLPYPGMMIPNVMVGHPRADYIMPPRPSRDDYDDSDDDYTSSDYSEVSISDDEKRSKSRESSRRKVQSPRRASRREVKERSDREKKGESRSSRESGNDRKSSRRRHDSDKDRKRKDPERSRTKPRKESENKEVSSSERKKSESSDEKNKSETEEKKADIKVKTLEEILREKALKNLHERTAQKKKAQLEADKAKQDNSDDSPEPILKSVISVSKAESTSSQKVSEPRDSDPEVEFVREKKARSPNPIILDIIDPDDESPAKTVRQVKVSEEDKIPESKDKDGKESELIESKPSGPDLANIRVKTFEEIMEEKRQRKALESKESVDENQVDSTETQRNVVDGKLSRKIRVVKKDENIKETKATSKILVKRKVFTKPKTGVLGSGEVEVKKQEEEKKEESEEEKKISTKERPNNIVIKSFDEIMREKRQRKQETTQATTQETTTTTVATTTTTVKRPTIIRNKQITTNLTKPFKTRKLKVIGRLGVSSSSKVNESVSEPASPNKSNPHSPSSPTLSKKPDHDPLSTGNAPEPSPCSPKGGATQPAQDFEEQILSQAGDDSDDDDSWEHEELPAVPPETPTLEGPARVPGIPNDDTSVLVIPGQVVQPGSNISPTKRPRSSLEELFGVPFEDTNSSNLSKESVSDDEGKDVSPAKKAKSNQQTYIDIVQAVNNEMSQKDDFDLDLEDEIANLPDKSFHDGNETLNEDDLLLELEEMINN